MQAQEKLTEFLLNKIESGEPLTWRRPWSNNHIPQNGVSKHHYRGQNFIILSFAPYADPRWFTFNQVQGLGGHVKKGASHWPVVFGSMKPKTSKNQADGDIDPAKRDMIYLYKYFPVFNAEQCEGLNIKPLDEFLPAGNKFAPIEAAEEVVLNMPNAPKISHGGSRACYSPMFDTVTMPKQGDFHDTEAYYSTLFHELGHSTGNDNRLGRKNFANSFGSDPYAIEELVAELASAFVCAHIGISNELDQSAAYMQGWLKRFAEKPRMFSQAAALAQKASDYILGIKYGEVAETA